MSTIFDDRRRALEESFFSKYNADLLENLRRQAGIRATRSAMAEASGIRDKKVLDELIDLGLEVETLAALGLVPLIEVAWADGKLSPEEKVAVLDTAEERGLHEGSPGHGLLKSWLRRKPEARLLHTWKNYVRALQSNLSPGARESLKDEVLCCARQVADATGGFLGVGNRISEAEERMIHELESAFL